MMSLQIIKKTSMKTILFFGAGAEHQIAIKLAKSMGYKVIAADANSKAPGLKFADVAVVEDIKDIDKMIAVGKKYKVDGVIVHAVEIPHIVSRVAKALGLPGIDPKVADRATFKAQRIDALEKAGLNVPEFVAVTTLAGAKKAAQKIGYPVVVKPTDNAGARGVKCVENEEQLSDAMEEALSFTHKPKVLIEQFLKGIEISTEHLIYNGKIYTTGFGDRNYTRSQEFYPYFIEDGHNVPSILPENVQKKIIKACEKTIRALGITWGVAKGDILYTKEGTIYIIEMAARTSGGWFCAGTVPLATGVHILKSLIKMAVGDPFDEADVLPTKNLWACQRYIIPTKSGKFVRLDGVAEAEKMPGVEMSVIFPPDKGEQVRKSVHNAERFGQIIAVGKTLDQATSCCEAAIAKIKIVLK